VQFLYSSLHPLIGVGIGHKWSRNSRLAKGISLEFLGEDKEDLIRYSKGILEKENIDYFVFGHRHISFSYKLSDGAEIIFLGDWVTDGSYAEWDGKSISLRSTD